MRTRSLYLTSGGAVPAYVPLRGRLFGFGLRLRVAVASARQVGENAGDVGTRFCAGLMVAMVLALALAFLLGQGLRGQTLASAWSSRAGDVQAARPAAAAARRPGRASGLPVADVPAASSDGRDWARRPISRSEVLRLTRRAVPGVVNLTRLHPDGSGEAGTGIVLSADGLVLTNDHVIAEAQDQGARVSAVDLGNGRTYRASVIGADAVHDVALVRLRGARGLVVARLGDSDRLRLGMQVGSLGNAYGRGGPSLGIGPVIALGRSIDSTTGAVRPLTGLIEARDGIRPGQSGGPMLTRDGVVVGVNVAYLYRPATGAPSGVGYAIPINRALRIAHVLLAHHTASGLGARGTHRAHHPGHARRARFGRVGSVIGAG